MLQVTFYREKGAFFKENSLIYKNEVNLIQDDEGKKKISSSD